MIIGKQGEESSQYQEFCRIVEEKKIQVVVVKQGDVINIEQNMKIRVLFPEKNLIGDNILNNNSLVFKIEYKEFQMLFTGDIEEIAEKKICSKYKNTNILEATVLKVAHHGSKTSSTIDFINAVNPKIALIGVGENNKFGHPNELVLDRLSDLGTKIYRTDESGEIVLVVDEKGRVKMERFIE